MIDSRKEKIPYAIVILRIFLTPLFFFVYMWDLLEAAVLLYLVAFTSDIVDGRIAKRLGTTASSTLEFYLDPIADFVFVLVSFYAFSLKQIYPTLILVVFIFMFSFFIFSSRDRKPIYDPVGKYYGTFLLGVIGITLLFPIVLIYNCLLLSIVVYTLMLVFYRTAFLLKNPPRNGDSKFISEMNAE